MSGSGAEKTKKQQSYKMSFPLSGKYQRDKKKHGPHQH
jgi:hypothetical protein